MRSLGRDDGRIVALCRVLVLWRCRRNPARHVGEPVTVGRTWTAPNRPQDVKVCLLNRYSCPSESIMDTRDVDSLSLGGTIVFAVGRQTHARADAALRQKQAVAHGRGDDPHQRVGREHVERLTKTSTTQRSSSTMMASSSW